MGHALLTQWMPGADLSKALLVGATFNLVFVRRGWLVGAKLGAVDWCLLAPWQDVSLSMNTMAGCIAVDEYHERMYRCRGCNAFVHVHLLRPDAIK